MRAHKCTICRIDSQCDSDSVARNPAKSPLSAGQGRTKRNIASLCGRGRGAEAVAVVSREWANSCIPNVLGANCCSIEGTAVVAIAFTLCSSRSPICDSSAVFLPNGCTTHESMEVCSWRCTLALVTRACSSLWGHKKFCSLSSPAPINLRRVLLLRWFT